MNGNCVVYFYVKAVQTLIYSKDISCTLNDFKNEISISPEYIINVILVFMQNNSNYMDDMMKDNALKCVSYFKSMCEVDDSNRCEFQDTINKIIRLINCSDDSEMYSLIRDQFQSRFLNDRVTKSALKHFDTSLDYVKNAVCLDFNLLISHSSFYCDELFETVIDNYIHDFLSYIGSINIICEEYPDILTNKIFVSRVKRVISMVKVSDIGTKKILKKIKKNIGI